jgi:hypothetical protein
MAEPKPKPIIGINYPAVQYGWDFGEPPKGWDGQPWQVPHTHEDIHLVSSAPSRSQRPFMHKLDDYLTCFQMIGIQVVRWQLLADCLTYRHATWKSERWSFDPPPIPKAFLDDFKHLLSKIQQYKLKLMPILLDNSAFWPGRAVVNFEEDAFKKNEARKNKPREYMTLHNEDLRRKHGESPERWLARLKKLNDKHAKSGAAATWYKGGRSDLLTKPNARTAFLDNVLEKLLGAVRNADLIYAWDIVNEPELAVEEGARYYNDPKVFAAEPENFAKTIPYDESHVCEFIAACAARISARRFKWTTGFVRYTTFAEKKWNVPETKLKSGADSLEERKRHYIPQFHYYGYPAKTPHSSAAPAGAIVGEFALCDPGKRCQKEKNDDNAWEVPSTKGKSKLEQVTELSRRMQALSDLGYPLALGWAAHATDQRAAWTKEVAVAIAKANGKDVKPESLPDAAFAPPSTRPTPRHSLQLLPLEEVLT